MHAAIGSDSGVSQHRPRPESLEASEIILDATVERIPVSIVGGRNEHFCPSCEQVIPPRKVRMFGKPPKYAYMLNDIIQCTNLVGDPPRPCLYIFSPASEVMVIRR